MTTFDLLGYLLPLAVALIYWLVLLLRKPAPVKNFFRTGQAQLLPETIEVNTHLSKKEFVAGATKNRRAVRNLVIYAAALTGVYAFNMKDYMPWLTADPVNIAIAAAPVVGLILIIAAGIYAARLAMGRQYDAAMSAKENIHYTFTPGYFESKGAYSTVKADWKTIDSFTDLPDMIVIQAAGVGLYLKKEGFETAQLPVFSNFLRANFQELKA